MPPSTNPLNPGLYHSLWMAMAKGIVSAPGNRIETVRPGQQTILRYERVKDGKKILAKIQVQGEAYAINCPLCRDTRGRLSINHLWLTEDPRAGKLHYLIKCFNEECTRTPGNVAKLEEMLDVFTLSTMPDMALAQQAHGTRPVHRITMPGPTVPVSQLRPEHPASVYLRSRGYDPRVVGDNYSLSYCTASSMAHARHRLIFPVTDNRKLLGWQARYLGPKGDGNTKNLKFCSECGLISVDLSGMDKFLAKLAEANHTCTCGRHLTPVPKYFTCPGFQKSQHVYNLSSARTYPYVVICEGVFDVLRVGTPTDPEKPGPAICLFGKTPSLDQIALLKREWGTGMAVVLLDSDVPDAEIAGVMTQFGGIFERGVTRVKLPTKDPGEATHGQIWSALTPVLGSLIDEKR